MKKFLLFGALISLMACSQVDTDVTDIPLGGTNITLGLPNTRTSLGEKENGTYPIYWSEEDKIVVNGAVSSSVIIDKNRKSATFNFANDILSYPYCITYPYTEGSACADGTPTVVFAAEQHFVEGTFGVGVAPMCGYCESGGSTSLKHLAGVLQLAIKGSSTLADIKISAAENVALSGEFVVDCQSGAISAIEGKVANKLTYVVNQTLSTTDATVCHIVVPAGNLGACKVLLTANNGEQMILKWSASDVKAGVVREFKEFVFKPGTMLELEGLPSEEDDLVIIPPTPRPANNEIWYTSTDGEIVTPNKSNAFGANIVSNIYENGKGVIKFDGEVTSIGFAAFYDDSRLTSITIPDCVTSIGESAFFNCCSITEINIPNSVVEIGVGAFYLPSAKHFYGKFASEDNRCLIVDGKLIAFAIGSGLTEYTISDSIISIEADTFRSCTSLAVVNIPDSVTSIGGFAFYNCTNLSSITIPHNVTTIGSLAFMECDLLMEIYCKPTTPPSIFYLYKEYEYRDDVIITNGSFPFNNGMKIYVPHESFSLYTQFSSSANGNVDQTNWSKYTSYIVGYDFESSEVVDKAENRTIWYAAMAKFDESSWSYETFGANIVSHEWDASGSNGLITFDKSITTIGAYAFYCGNGNKLLDIVIPDSVTSIGNNAFDGADFRNVNIPNGVTYIGDYAFSCCGSLQSVTIPENVKTIGKYAFAYGGINEVYCKASTPPTLGVGGIEAWIRIYVPADSEALYKNTWSDYSSYIVGYDF